MKYRGLEIKDVFYSSAPDGSMASLLLAKDITTGNYNLYFGSMKKSSQHEKADIAYIINFGTKLKCENFKKLMDKICDIKDNTCK